MGKKFKQTLTKRSPFFAAITGKKSALWEKYIDPDKPKLATANKKLFDVTEEIVPFQEEYKNITKRASEAGAATGARSDVLKQMGQAALGRGPSLAEAQMKSAQDRNLAQQLATVQSSRGGGSALSQRALLQNMGESGRNMAQDASIARMQERNDFMNQSGVAEQGLRNTLQESLSLNLMPKAGMKEWEMARVAQANAQAKEQAAKDAAMGGAIIGGIASIYGGPAAGKAAQAVVANKADGGLVTKKDIKKKAAKMATCGYKKGGQVKGYKHGGEIDETERESPQEIKHETRTQRDIVDEIEHPKYTEVDNQAPVPNMDAEAEMEKRSREIMEKYAQKELEREAAAGRMPAATSPDEEGYQLHRRKRFDEGGSVEGPGTETSDSIAAMLSDGEFVIKASEVKKPGILEHLEAINAGKVSKKDLSALAKAIENKESGRDEKSDDSEEDSDEEPENGRE